MGRKRAAQQLLCLIRLCNILMYGQLGLNVCRHAFSGINMLIDDFPDVLEQKLAAVIHFVLNKLPVQIAEIVIGAKAGKR